MIDPYAVFTLGFLIGTAVGVVTLLVLQTHWDTQHPLDLRLGRPCPNPHVHEVLSEYGLEDPDDLRGYIMQEAP